MPALAWGLVLLGIASMQPRMSWAEPGSAEACAAAAVLDVVPPAAGRERHTGAGASTTGDYRHQLRPTAHGWPRRDRWCVWVDPAQAEGPASRWDQAWLEAVEKALASWAELVPIERVSRPEQAQVRILRRRPPLRGGRASHGRAELQLAVVERDGRRQLEPRVVVQISPGQRASAMQATALHELGHAFGLWGHSEADGDAMAAVPGASPVLELSPRDRATFLWLQQQPGLGPAPIP
jgi:predicted Zn-dependent protease